MVLDASVVVSSLVSHDVGHEPSRRWLADHMKRGGLLVAPTLLLAEVAGAVARRTGAPRLGRRAALALLRWPTLRLVALDEPISHTAAALAARLRLRGGDAVYVATAALLHLPLVTWDSEQRTRAANVIDVIGPPDTPV